MVSQSGPLLFVPRHLLGRLYLFAAVLIVDCLCIAGIPHPVDLLGPLASSGIVAFAVFVVLGYSRLKLDQENIPFNAWFFGAHLLSIVAVCLGNLAALNGFAVQRDSAAGQLTLRTLLLLGIGLLALACLPLRTGVRALRSTSPSWLFAVLAGGLAWCLRSPFQSLWYASSNSRGRILQVTTFDAAYSVLRGILPGVAADPARFIIGTPRFSIFIAKSCSGIEGLGLVLVFTTAWLIYFRKENRFPQALLLVPCALVCMWMLNVVRICSLILIGDAGAPDVAMLGFHSQAGWIAFTTAAFAFSMAASKLSWVRRTPSAANGAGSDAALAGSDRGTGRAEIVGREAGESPATRAYLIPFLAILAASFVSKAAAGYLEWLYPLRFVSTAIALWFFRAELRKLNWRFGWIAPLTGTAIFLLWIASSWWTKEPSASHLGTALAALSPTARLTWIAFRVAAAGVTVPIAEELAFRGYLVRRLIDREFEAVPFSNLTLLSMGVSSVVFGALHSQHWMAGILAGLAYAALLKSRGRMGDAVVAHATSNLLLAAWVLLRADWAQW
jgi:exosortase E/protease (VPEID-CTERM system)